MNKIVMSFFQVYLTGHVPPFSFLYKPGCYTAYNEITSVYNSTILAHIYGHTHSDQFQMIMNNRNEPVGVINVAPSVVSTFNPGLRMFSYDKATKVLQSIIIYSSPFNEIDIHQYYVNLDEANAYGNVTFQLEYEQLSAYSIFHYILQG